MYSEIKDFLKNSLSEHRYEHSLSVCEEILCLAPFFNLTEKEKTTLYLSALLHDITREKKLDAQLELCQAYNIDYTEEELAFSFTFHQKTGGMYAREQFGSVVTDEVIEIISSHTTGAPNMSILQKLLFLADSTEATRKHQACIELRKYLHSNLNAEDSRIILDRACLLSLDNTVRHLVEKGLPIDIQTMKARNYLLLSEVKNNENN